MIKFLLGVVVGIVLATYGTSGVIRAIDKGVNETVKFAKSLAK